MTTTINIKAIIITLIAAMAVIALATLAMGHRSVSHTKVQMWQADTSWTQTWNMH